jgi:hypothetical protein
VSNRIVAALAAGFLAIGILVGAAGAVLVGNATAPNRVGMDGSMRQMMTMMGGAGADGMSDLHAQHHGSDR